jgi:hypothetical protein
MLDYAFTYVETRDLRAFFTDRREFLARINYGAGRLQGYIVPSFFEHAGARFKPISPGGARQGHGIVFVRKSWRFVGMIYQSARSLPCKSHT